MITIAIANQKGGVGKSTTAWALAAFLTQLKYRVLTIDIDAQCNLSYSVGLLESDYTSLEVLKSEVTLDYAIQHTRDFGDIVPASPVLSQLDLSLNDLGKEYRLKQALEAIDGLYDIVLLDCPPALGVCTINALVAADRVIIPAKADIYSVQGIHELHKTLLAVRKFFNKGLTVYTILRNEYSPRLLVEQEISDSLAQLASLLGCTLSDITIPKSVKIKELQANREAPAPKICKAAESYYAFAQKLASDLLA